MMTSFAKLYFEIRKAKKLVAKTALHMNYHGLKSRAHRIFIALRIPSRNDQRRGHLQE